MSQRFGILTTVALLACAPIASADSAAERFAPKRRLNLDIWVEWRGVQDMADTTDLLAVYPEWLRYVRSQSLARVPAAGFDFVRLPMDPGPLLAIGPGPRQDKLIAGIVAIATRLQGLGLKVIVDLHSLPRPDNIWGSDNIVTEPAHFAARIALTGKVAAALNGMTPDRAGAPDLLIVLSGACRGGIDGSELINPGVAGDDNVIWWFHSCDPFVFTHQGAPWVTGPERCFTNIPSPGGTITDGQATDWSQRLRRVRPKTSVSLPRHFILAQILAPQALLVRNLHKAQASPKRACQPPCQAGLCKAWPDGRNVKAPPSWQRSL